MSEDSNTNYMHPDVDTTSYIVAVPDNDWEAWKQSIPRTRPLYDRIHALIEIDTAFDGDVDLAELRLVTMQFGRIEQRCQTALEAIHDGNTEKARDELRAIRDIATEHSD